MHVPTGLSRENGLKKVDCELIVDDEERKFVTSYYSVGPCTAGSLSSTRISHDTCRRLSLASQRIIASAREPSQ
eukprot:661463-Pleurochrysis_carterae.AAC.7